MIIAKVKTQIHRRIDAALGRIPCDLIIRDTHYLDVFSCEFRSGDIAVANDTIIALEPGLKARREIDGRGRFVVPGFIDAHVHLESSLMLPHHFESEVLARGTTTAICDPHELANVVGVPGIEYFLETASNMAMDLRIMLSSCVPATHMETNGAGTITAADLWNLKDHPRALGLAEMMNFPGVLSKDPAVIEKLVQFENAIIDGHCPRLTGRSLSAYIAAGISSCHESSELEEAREKLTKGMGVWIREGSVAKDLRELIPLLNTATSVGIGFCTDDRNPLDIHTEGHLDYLVRRSISYGIPPAIAFRAASWSVARHYGLRNKGAVAPGQKADLVILQDVDEVAIEKVLVGGKISSEISQAPSGGLCFEQSVRAHPPEPGQLQGPRGQVHIIDVWPGKILTGRLVDSEDACGVLKLSCIERYGKGTPPANGYVRGFGERFKGAIASTVAHDSHNLIVVGSDVTDMAVACKALIECGGGFVIAQDRSVKALLPLPMAGLMTDKSPSQIVSDLIELRRAARDIGCVLNEPFLQLAFLSLPVIPSLKLTDKGLVDVDRFMLIPVAA